MSPNAEILQFYSSPEQIQTLANLAHNVPGYIICGIAMLFLVAELGYHKKTLATMYSSVFMLMPISFIGFVFFSNGLSNARSLAEVIAQYPEVYLHILTLIGNLIGGIGEILYVHGRIRHPLGAFFLPTLFFIDGFLSILHPHGANGHHDLFHNVYGSLMVLTGILIITERLIQEEFRKFAAIAAAVSMCAPAIMLITYTEPANAYRYAFPSDTALHSMYATKDTDVIVYVTDAGVIPREMLINTGSSITFIQIDESIHEIESGPHPQHDAYPPLNIGPLHKGEKRRVTFTNTGYFGFHDHAHDDDVRFHGSVTVRK